MKGIEVIIDKMLLPMAVINENLEYEYINIESNKIIKEIFDKKIENGNKITSVFDEKYANKYIADIEMVRKYKERLESTLRIEIKGKRRCFNRILIPITEKNECMKIIEVIIEITEKIEFEEKIEELLRYERELGEVIPIPIFYKDLDLKYTGVNKAFEEFLQKDRKEIIGKSVEEIFEKKYADIYREKDIELINSKEKQIYESKINRSTGEERIVKLHNIIFVNSGGEVTGIIGAILDITEEKQLNNLKNKLLRIMSHDLRVPIGSGKELLSYIIKDYENITGEEIKENLIGLRYGLENIYELINNLLSWTEKRETKSSEITEIRETIQKAVRAYEFSINQKGQKLNINIGNDKIYGRVSKEDLETIIRNLVTNAIKYSKNGSQIDIEAREKEKLVEIEMRDNGIGMSQDKIKQILETNNMKVGQGTNGEVGSGIGMQLIKELVLNNEGKLEIKSEEGKGTKVIIKLKK